MRMKDFDNIIRKACGRYCMNTRLDCRYLKTNDYNRLRRLDGLPEYPYEGMDFYFIGVIIEDVVKFASVIESDKGIYTPSYDCRKILHEEFYRFIVEVLGIEEGNRLFGGEIKRLS